MITIKRMLFCACFFLAAALYTDAQTIKDSSITHIKERAYKLIELPNGDLVPFVNQGQGNIDKYLESGRLVKEVFLDLFGKKSGHRIYTYYGDTLQLTKEYNAQNELTETDSVIFAGKKVKEGFHTEFRRSGTVSTHMISIDTGNVVQKTVYMENDKITRTRLLTRSDSLTLYFHDIETDGKQTNRDTLHIYYYPDKLSKLVTFHTPDHFSYTINEYGTDQYGNITSAMTFYNQDSVGDHISSFIRRIEYKNQKPPVIDRKFFYGYWVMMHGMRYWQFLENGKVLLRRAGKEQETLRSWGWDEQRKQVYIILTAEEKEDLAEFKPVGNRLYLVYEPDEQYLVYGDTQYQKRPALKRKPRDEKKVKAMLTASEKRK